MVVGVIADVLAWLTTMTLKMDIACTSKMWATSPTMTQCSVPRTELTSVTYLHSKHRSH